MSKDRIQKIINDIYDVASDLECDNQEYFMMYRNDEISPEEYDEKSSEISKQLNALEKAHNALLVLTTLL